MKTKTLYLLLPLITLSVALLGSCHSDKPAAEAAAPTQDTGAFRTPF